MGQGERRRRALTDARSVEMSEPQDAPVIVCPKTTGVRQMKYVFALIGGFALTLAVFVAGALMATIYIVAEPRNSGPAPDTAAMWTRDAVRVVDTGDLERVPARPTATAAEGEDQAETADAAGAVDGMVTGAIAAEAGTRMDGTEEQPAAEPSAEVAAQMQRLRLAHDRWCSRRYRSYRAEDGTYQPYGGGRQMCDSPYRSDLEAAIGGDFTIEANTENAFVLEGDGFGAELETAEAGREPVWNGGTASDHVRSCFERYRSYRPEDNSYQPFDGGPRRQCE